MSVSSLSYPASLSSSNAVRIASAAAEALAKNAPLLDREEVLAYREHIQALARHLAPGDVLGWLILRDFIDCDVEVRQLRTAKAALIVRARGRAAAIHPGLEQYTLPAAKHYWNANQSGRRNMFDLDEDEADDTAHTGNKSEEETDGNTANDSAADKEAVAKPSNRPRARPKSKRERQAELANAFLDCLADYERIDHLLGRAVAARKEALRLFNEHAARERLLRETVVEAEFTDVPATNGSDPVVDDAAGRIVSSSSQHADKVGTSGVNETTGLSA